MEGYIYLGEHYDVLGREISITDKKIGEQLIDQKKIKSILRHFLSNNYKKDIIKLIYEKTICLYWTILSYKK